MFEKFKELFGSENLLDAAYKTTVTMLEFDYKMFDASRKTLRESNTAELPFDFKATDRKINKYEREVRRNVLTHLTVAGMQNLVPGLVLVSIVIDVERIGDYTKNIAGLASLHPERLEGGPHEKALQKMEKTIELCFPAVIDVLKTHEKAGAREIMRREMEVARLSDQLVNSLIVERKPSFSTGDAVAVAMYARYLKRINAHLTNIASAIVNPFPRIGFREKPKGGKEK
jgi:phosphate transport system protein